MPSKSQSRNASPTTLSSRRPKLMRAAATAPTIATSNASRNDLASLQQGTRAAALLSRVATYATAQQNCEREHRTSIGSACSSGHGSPDSPDSTQGLERKAAMVQQSGNYFSFPSFEDFQEYQHQSDRHQNGD
ncbi:uncharacterized protein L3040_004530 [Drepanopeziza brunnea f. sp. 'multigermtubi']|uniref:Uncharacterized protein n=1 Tax=Marssonina brunnea f. sp. multigermtubi (strain MB_m1) TaxID=1072389 RepID=K1WJW7_MARBU|nr:uncharacterized protein MBM_03762 [Drepanopeziza brunnea f. sp. 'multigermtubi' MB_m1]EKD17990.1 hypothetical protein MBM_03762 [Drepanopeziza brunnea f. sp. 'multigermtubi' MB_m1]KAJ5043149.1 hypothetical protein L3040_004530 [Drepanopeziza brunnea f. sp. 'multigermtubi']